MLTRYWAIVSGILFVLVGVLGFLPGTHPLPFGPPPIGFGAEYGFLFGIFPVNALHNLVHIALGIWGLVAFMSFAAARIYSRGLAIIYGVLTIMGFVPGLNTVFGFIPIFGADVWLHLATAIVSAYFGWAAPVQAREYERSSRV